MASSGPSPPSVACPRVSESLRFHHQGVSPLICSEHRSTEIPLDDGDDGALMTSSIYPPAETFAFI
jgi:hypothetical protein